MADMASAAAPPARPRTAAAEVLSIHRSAAAVGQASAAADHASAHEALKLKFAALDEGPSSTSAAVGAQGKAVAGTPSETTIKLGEHGEFGLLCEDGPLQMPADVVAHMGLRLPRLWEGLSHLGVRPACTFPILINISHSGGKSPRPPAKGITTVAYTPGLDFDWAHVDHAVASQIMLGTTAPPPAWAWLVDGTLGCLAVKGMGKAEQFQVNAATLTALRESRGPSAAGAGRGGGAKPARHEGEVGPKAGAPGPAPPKPAGPRGAKRVPDVLLSVLGGPTARNHAHYRLLATSFVSFLAAAYPKTFGGELVQYARQQISSEEPRSWEGEGTLLKGRRAFLLHSLERAWQEWVEGHVDGKRRGVSWVFNNSFRLMGAFPARIAVSFLGLICQLAMQALLILSFARVVDAADKGDEAELRKFVILLGSFGAASILGSHAYAYIQSSVIARTLENLQVELMRHLLSLPDAYLRDTDEGSLLSYFASDIWALEPTLASVFRIIQAGATFLLQLALMFSLDYRIAPVVIVVQLVIVFSQRAHNSAVARASSDKQKTVSSDLSAVKEVVMGATVIRDYGLSKKTLTKFRESLALTTDALFRLRMHSMMFVTAIICFNQFLQGVTLSFMGYLALNGIISKGQLSAIYLNVTTLGSASATIVNMVPEVTKGSGPLQRICAFLLIPEDEELAVDQDQGAEQAPAPDPAAPAAAPGHASKGNAYKVAPGVEFSGAPPEDSEPDVKGKALAKAAPGTAQAALRGEGRRKLDKLKTMATGEASGPFADERPVQAIDCRRVSFAYHAFGARTILNSVSVSIRPCTSVCIVGGSGCGKSTLLGILMRTYRPTKGTVEYGGTSLPEIPSTTWKRHVRVVQQSAFIFNETVRYNIAVGKPGAGQDEVEAAAALAQIHEAILELPEGYDTVISMKSLSGGQKQRIAIARALIGEPRVLVLDECTSALDAETERRINAMIESISRRMTVVQVTHRLAAAEKCDEIIVLDKGQVVERGPFRALAEAKGFFARLLHQAGEFDETPPGPARTPEEVAALLRRLVMFSIGPDEPLLDLAKSATVEEYRKGDILWEQDTPATHLGLALSGVLSQVQRGPEGKLHPHGTLKQGMITDVLNVLLAAAPPSRAIVEGPAGRSPWNRFSLHAATDVRFLRLPLLAVNHFLMRLTKDELARALPEIEEGRRAVFNWRHGRARLGHQLTVATARGRLRNAAAVASPPPEEGEEDDTGGPPLSTPSRAGAAGAEGGARALAAASLPEPSPVSPFTRRDADWGPSSAAEGATPGPAAARDPPPGPQHA